MAFKMKGHTLPGPYQQKKQVDKANAAAQAANAARSAARTADKEFKTFAYDYAEPGTARADSLGGSYNEENMKRFNELGGIREDAYKDADKAYKAYEKAADKAKKKGATSSPAKQKSVSKANKAITKANTASDALNSYLQTHGTKQEDGSYQLSEEHMKGYNKLKKKADKNGGKAGKKTQKAIDAGASPAKQRKTHPEDQEYGPTDRTKKASVEKRKKRMEKEYTGRGGKFTGKGGGLKDASLEELKKHSSSNKKKLPAYGPGKSPAKKKSPYKVAPLVAAAGKMAAKAVAGQVASKAAKKATGGDE